MRTPPIESFGPELMAALLAGSKGEHKLQLPYRSAIKFRQRVYQLRRAIQDAKHPEAAAVAKTRVLIKWPESTATYTSKKKVSWPQDPKTICDVIIAPYDSEFSAALKASGIEAKELDDDVLQTPAPTPDPSALKGFEPQ